MSLHLLLLNLMSLLYESFNVFYLKIPNSKRLTGSVHIILLVSE